MEINWHSCKQLMVLFLQLNAFLKGTPSYYNGDKAIPMLPIERKRLYSAEDILKLLLHSDLKSSRFVATKVPTMICNSVSFVVKDAKLANTYIVKRVYYTHGT